MRFAWDGIWPGSELESTRCRIQIIIDDFNGMVFRCIHSEMIARVPSPWILEILAIYLDCPRPSL